MKNFLRSKKVHMMLGSAALLVASCYTIKNIEMPHEVAPGEEFTMRATIGSDSGANKSDNTFGVFGVRVPSDWDVTIPENVLEHYGADGVLDETISGVPNEIVTNILNHRYPKDGYKWIGFSTGIDANEKMKLEFKGDDDCYVVNAKIKPSDVEGDYELDFVFGDEEDSFTKYADKMDHDPNQDPRLFETATFAPDPTKENQINNGGETKPSIHAVVDADTSVKVSKGAGVETISADEFVVEGAHNGIRVIAAGSTVANAVVTVYSVQGQQIDCQSVVEGEATLRAVKGLNIVEVLKGKSKAVKKVFVK